jgi:hypothetical protein
MRSAMIVVLLVSGACAIDWPASSRGNSLPDDDMENGPKHRAGQPCLYCHGGPFPSAPEFVFAGTVYLKEADAKGLSGATISITDAAGTVITGTSNSVGNFFAGGGHNDREGFISLPPGFAFPLTVTVAFGSASKPMRSYIAREGSCAQCHGEPPGRTLVGKVFVEDP